MCYEKTETCPLCKWPSGEPYGQGQEPEDPHTNDAFPLIKLDLPQEMLDELEIKDYEEPYVHFICDVFNPSIEEKEHLEQHIAMTNSSIFGLLALTRKSEARDWFYGILTDYRIILYEKHNFLQKNGETEEVIETRYKKKFSIDYSQIREIGLRYDKQIVEIILNTSLSGERLEISGFQDVVTNKGILLIKMHNTILKLMKNREVMISNEKDLLKLRELDFKELKKILSEGGIVIQVTKCKNCGANIKLPENGSYVQCDYCKSHLYAYDLIKKIKEMI